jgi:hypothetical protein
VARDRELIEHHLPVCFGTPTHEWVVKYGFHISIRDGLDSRAFLERQTSKVGLQVSSRRSSATIRGSKSCRAVQRSATVSANCGGSTVRRTGQGVGVRSTDAGRPRTNGRKTNWPSFDSAHVDAPELRNCLLRAKRKISHLICSAYIARRADAGLRA